MSFLVISKSLISINTMQKSIRTTNTQYNSLYAKQLGAKLNYCRKSAYKLWNITVLMIPFYVQD